MGFFSSFGNKSTWLHLTVRSLQLVCGLVVLGLYAVDLNAARRADKYADAKWVFAVTTGSLAAATALLFSLVNLVSQYRTVAMAWPLDVVVFIAFLVLSVIFGVMYWPERVEMESGISRMKVAAGFDLAGMILFLGTGLQGWYTGRKQKRKSPKKSDPEEREWHGDAGLEKLPKTALKDAIASRFFRNKH